MNIKPDHVIRMADCGDTPTGAQRAYARTSGLYNQGDCVLVWINEGDLDLLILSGKVKYYPKGNDNG